MKYTLILAAGAAVLCSSMASAQARRTPASASVTPAGAPPPSDFASCQPMAAPENTFYGPKTVYLNCLPVAGPQDYGSVFVRFKPPSRTEFQGIDRRRKRDILSALRRFFLPEKTSASLVLTLSLARRSAPGVAAPAETPIAAITLTSFSYDENQGLKFTDAGETTSNMVGYRFQIAPDDKVVARIRVLYGKNTTSNIVGTLNDVSKTLSSVGVLDPISQGAIGPLTDLETKIANQATVDVRSDKVTNLGFEANGISGLYVPVRIEQNRENDGALFVVLQREHSIFKAATLDNDAVKFKISGSGAVSAGPIANTYLGDKKLSDLIAGAMGTSFLKLSSPEPVAFDVACKTLWENIDTKYNLSTPDKMAAFWAIFLTSADKNAGKKKIRQTDCISNRESANNFEQYGLPLPAIDVEIPAEYVALQEQAEKAASLGQDGALAARNASDSAHGFAARARLIPAGAGTAHVSNDAYDYFGQDYGQAAISRQPFLGVHRFLSGNKEEYAGEFALNGQNAIRQGNGVLTYDAANRGPQARRRFMGAFIADSPNGFGELDYLDDRTYFGQLIGDAPSGLGKLIMPDGTIQIGNFMNGKLHGKAIETSKTGAVRYGIWANGNLVTPNPN